jgi:hypothetical protein
MRPDRLMWGAGLALAGAVLTGLVLNMVTGLTRLSWAVALAIAVVAAACAGLVIRRRSAVAVTRAPVWRRGFRLSPVTSGFLLLAAVLATAAVWLANASAGWQPAPGFAQLWLTPASGTTSTLGVRDNYPGQQTFRLVLRGDGGKVLGTWDLALAEGQAWQRTVTQPADGTLTATLGGPGQALTVTS